MASAPPRSRVWNSVEPRLDRIAIGLSGLCVLHCVSTPLLLTFLSAGGILVSPMIHVVGLLLAIALGIVALGRGFRKHRKLRPALIGALGLVIMASALLMPHGATETIWTLVGVTFVAIGHFLNGRAPN